MANKILQTIVDSKIKRFTNEFCNDSENIFYDQKEKKLLHPGEFGMYREKIVKEFLNLFIPQNRSIANGFIINSKNEISTQCDIVIYDKINTPIIRDDKKQIFYPIETVCGIGEVKSKLYKNNFTESINRLAFIKKMRKNVNTSVIYRDPCLMGKKIDIDKVLYDQIFTFLICKEFTFKTQDFLDTPQNFFGELDTKLRPNLILSIKDGIFAYKDKNQKFIYYPNIKDSPLELIQKKNDDTLRIFGAYTFAAISAVTIFHPDLTNYLLLKSF